MSGPIALFVDGISKAQAAGAVPVRRARAGLRFCDNLRAAVAAATDPTTVVTYTPEQMAQTDREKGPNYVGMLFGVDIWVDTTLPTDALEFDE
jgi:hypothetical protein